MCPATPLAAHAGTVHAPRAPATWAQARGLGHRPWGHCPGGHAFGAWPWFFAPHCPGPCQWHAMGQGRWPKAPFWGAMKPHHFCQKGGHCPATWGCSFGRRAAGLLLGVGTPKASVVPQHANPINGAGAMWFCAVPPNVALCAVFQFCGATNGPQGPNCVPTCCGPAAKRRARAVLEKGPPFFSIAHNQAFCWQIYNTMLLGH